MSSKITRVHGAATLPSIVWPADELAARFAIIHARHCDGGFRSPCECFTWERRCTDDFAQANDLVVSHAGSPRFGRLDFVRDVLPLVDHHVFFRTRRSQRISAILSHNYKPQPDFSPLGDHVIVDQLPRSWYFRGGVDATTAFLLRLAP